MGSEELKQLATADLGLSVALESASAEHAFTLKQRQRAIRKRMRRLLRRRDPVPQEATD